MKRLLLIITMLFWGIAYSGAQVKSLYAEARLDFDIDAGTERTSTRFSPDQVNLVLSGNIIPSLSYFWRQRFTKSFVHPTIPLPATDMLYLKWDINSKWSIQGGKIPVVVGGYEFDDAPVDLYYWDAFAGRLADVYAFGGNFIYNPAPNQSVMLQVTQSLLGFGYKDVYHAAILWYGQIAPWWNTIWSLNWMDDPTHRGLGIVSLGNRFEAGKFALELDLSYRTALFGGAPLNLDYGAIAKLEYSFPIVTVFAKGGYSRNRDCPIDVLPMDYSLLYAGGGVEVFPLSNDDLRLHAVAWWNTDLHYTTVSLGVTYRLRILKYLPR